MVYVRTCAYNAEKTLREAIESVLNQSYGDFVYYILDNGSTDMTGEIITEYAKKDERVVPFYNKKNRVLEENPDFWLLTKNLKEEDYFCILDADDSYDLTFLEEMLAFMKENELDMAACGSRFVDGKTGNVVGERVLERNYVAFDEQSFDMEFPMMHWNLRQAWGKVYTARAARVRYEIELPEWFPRSYGGDTVNVYACVAASDRIGVYGKCLHSYLLSSGSISYEWRKGRELCDFTLFEKAQELLIQKCGRVSPRNLNFLYAVQFSALKDTLRVLFKSDLSAERKLELLKGTFEHPITKQTFREEGNTTQEEKTKLLTEVVCAVIDLAQDVTDAALSDAADICNVFNTSFSELIPADQLGWYVKKLPIVVRNVALGEYEHGVNHLLVYLAKEREADLAVDYPFVLGQILASLRNEDVKYVYFSKQLIRWCMENNQPERARQDLEEWIQILPGDKELIELNSMLQNFLKKVQEDSKVSSRHCRYS